jgi:hypothetical protein
MFDSDARRRAKCDHLADLVYCAMASATTSAPRLERDLSPFFPVDIARLIIGYVHLSECFITGYIGRRDAAVQITSLTLGAVSVRYGGDTMFWRDTRTSLIDMLDCHCLLGRPYDVPLRKIMAEALK